VPQGRIRHKSDAEFAANGQHIGFHVSRPERVLPRFADDAELCRNTHVWPARREESTDQFLVVVRAVHVSGVEKIDAEFDSPIEYL
jgi:hypothetical protein